MVPHPLAGRGLCRESRRWRKRQGRAHRGRLMRHVAAQRDRHLGGMV